MKTIHVVAAIIYSPCREKVLIARRPEHLHQGGLWEFPGGKVESGEAPEQALARELQEELGITPCHCGPHMQVSHQYPDKSVYLDFWHVTTFSGEPRGIEGQQIAWVPLHHLPDYDFPKANEVVVEALLVEYQRGVK